MNYEKVGGIFMFYNFVLGLWSLGLEASVFFLFYNKRITFIIRYPVKLFLNKLNIYRKNNLK